MTSEITDDGVEIDGQYVAAVESLTEQVRVVTDILDEIRDELQWAVRNRQPLRIDRLTISAKDWRARLSPSQPEPMKETIMCLSCNVESPPSVAIAIQQGWTELVREDGSEWNYLGTCPICTARERQAPNESSTYCCDKPELVWEGDPDAPSVVCRNCQFLVAENGSVIYHDPTEPEPLENAKSGSQGSLF